jgi:hypothetical protein
MPRRSTPAGRPGVVEERLGECTTDAVALGGLGDLGVPGGDEVA